MAFSADYLLQATLHRQSCISGEIPSHRQYSSDQTYPKKYFLNELLLWQTLFPKTDQHYDCFSDNHSGKTLGFAFGNNIIINIFFFRVQCCFRMKPLYFQAEFSSLKTKYQVATNSVNILNSQNLEHGREKGLHTTIEKEQNERLLRKRTVEYLGLFLKE